MAININIPSQFREYNNLAAFPTTGSAKILYVAKNNNKLYRWDTSAYVEVSPQLASSWGSITGNLASQVDLQGALDNKVNTESGKGLSTNDYTTTEKNKLAGIASGAEVNVNADWNATSGDAEILNKPTIPSIAGLATTSYVDSQDATKQDVLVSGTNVKTVEGQSILGSGNIDISKSDVGLGNVDNTSDANKPISTATQTALNAKQATLVSGTNIKTINGTTVLGSGDITISGGSGVTDVTATSPLASTGGTNPDISITQANATDDGYLSTGDWNAFNNKQDALSSGTNIKTINSTSVLGSGDIAVQPTLVSGTNIKTINGSSVLGSGDLVVGGGGGGIHVIVKPQTGNQVSTLTASTNSGFNVGAMGFRMQAFPFYPASSFTCSSLTLNVTTLIAGGIARILIYSDVNGKPSAKLYESANLDCSTTGLKTASTTFNFVAGTKYWITVQSNSASIAFTLQPQNFSTVVSTSGLATRYTSYILNSIAIGSAPATWTGGTLHAFEFPFVYITSA